MAHPFFKFKRFTVWHDCCAMKVGTDGVLLGAWAPLPQGGRILDIGTGTGLVALMLAQRSPQAQIVGIEIDPAAAHQAGENILRSPWGNRIEIVHTDFNEYTPEEKYQLIVSNPPYFSDSLGCPDSRRHAARHNTSLSYHSLLSGVARLLTKDGCFALVIPFDVAETVKEIGAEEGLHCVQQLNVQTKPGSAPKRCLLAFSFSPQPCHIETLLIEREHHHYTEEYKALTKDFYLNM